MLATTSTADYYAATLLCRHTKTAERYLYEETVFRLYKRKVETRAAYDDEALREALTRVSRGCRLSVPPPGIRYGYSLGSDSWVKNVVSRGVKRIVD
ncbi:hypothetical protein LSAT2_003836 [Lamellibrachia satsuma]|nr:hypothetical protein LSAT2_003836 [Lamellibrachia satsuma]